MNESLLEFLRKGFASIDAPQEVFWVFNELKALDEVSAREKANEFILRRKNGEPLAYIFGHWDFRKLKLSVGPGVLIPRPETEGLVDLILETLPKSEKKSLSVADLGAGSGAIGLSLLSESSADLEVYFVENSPEALHYLHKNTALLSDEKKRRAKIFESDWNRFSTPVDIIVSNPPYVSEEEFQNLSAGVKNFEPYQALVSAQDPHLKYKEIFEKAKEILKPGGRIFFEFGPAQMDQWASLVPKKYLWKTFKDLSSKERYLIAFDTTR